MGAFNTVTTTIACRRCGNDVPLRIQFKYGSTWQHEYRVGDTLKWGGNEIGKPGKRQVVVDGIAEPCPTCNYDDEWSFYVFIERDVITRVEAASGQYDFPAARESYLVLEE